MSRYTLMLTYQILRHPFLIWIILFNVITCIPNKLRPQINNQLGIIDRYIFENPIGSILTLICTCLGSQIIMDIFYNEPVVQKMPYPVSVMHKTRRYQIIKRIPVYLMACSWIYLKSLDFLIEPNKAKNIFGVVVILSLHFLIIPITVIYLKPNHAKLYLRILGSHNIGILVLHFIFPSCPPLYKEINGDKAPIYDDPQYFEGVNLGYNYLLNIINYGLSLTTTEFGIMPSLHSSISILLVLFCIYGNGDNKIKLGSLVYLGLVIWLGIYFKHHWKLDNLLSFIYSILWFSVNLKRINSSF